MSLYIYIQIYHDILYIYVEGGLFYIYTNISLYFLQKETPAISSRNEEISEPNKEKEHTPDHNTVHNTENVEEVSNKYYQIYISLYHNDGRCNSL